MKLHRLVLTNYRGITHRDIEFPDRGVVVVSGANEIGKSSMIEALDLLFDAKDRSAKKEVKQVKPTHADVGAEVTAEISTGPYRFVYRKRFHKRHETQLTLLAPRREEFSGDEAHDRVRTILAETVDLDLWQAQRVWQSASTAVVDLSGSDALARALDVAAGQAVSLSGAEPLLIDRIDAEFRRYFTPTGRPTGEWAAAVRRLHDADDAVARCAAAVAEVEDAVRRHATLTDELGVIGTRRDEALLRLAAARAASDAVAELTRQHREAAVVADAAAARHTASLAALTERRRLRADIDERASAVTALEAVAGEAVDAEATAREVQEAADAAADGARAAVESGESRVAAARRAVERVACRDEADRLAARLAKIDAAARESARAERELADIAITDTAMRAIETAAVTLEHAAGQVQAASACIELVAAADVDLVVAGEQVRLSAGAVWSGSTAAATDIDIPGVLAVRIAPGAPAAETQEKYVAAQRLLRHALESARVPDLGSAREVHRRRGDLLSVRDRLRATSDALTGEDTVEGLRARLAELRDGQPPDVGLFELGADGPLDGGAARAELDAAVAAHRQAAQEAETHRKVAVAAGRRLAECATRAGVAREKLTTAGAELIVARERLAVQRTTATDDDLALAAQADGEEAGAAAARLAELAGTLAATAPETVAVALADAVRGAESLESRHREVADMLREVAAQLTVYGTQGRKGQLDAAQTEREHAVSEHQRVRHRARAVEVLRDVIVRHRDATRARYADPFRTQVERLGRLVFGESFEVDVDSALRIVSRTVSGRTVPYESLSGGAKEQLGIVARLAGAVLVAKEDGVPVVIDDALGFTDSERLTRMGAVFDAVGGDGQVIVLTCSPDRYAGIGDAHRIELTPEAISARC